MALPTAYLQSAASAIPPPQLPIVDKPFVYGSAAFNIAAAGLPPSAAGHSHRWTIYLRGLDLEDQSAYIEHVTFQLHNTYANSARRITQPPYEVNETGWGEFEIQITVTFRDATPTHPATVLTLMHHLKLFPPPATVVNGQIQEPNLKLPVMSEHYDEFVFVAPDMEFKRRLDQPPAQKFSNHPLRDYFTTQEFATDEQQCIVRLQAALNKVHSSINVQRAKLFVVEQQIQELNS